LQPGRARADQFTGLNGAATADLENAIFDPRYPDEPDVVRYTPGMTFGEPAFGDTWGDNHLVAMRAILIPEESGNYRFFVRSDDAARLFLNTSGHAVPDPRSDSWIAEETGCCTGFLEPPEESVSEPVSLTAGQQYGLLFVVKEGGGGDWGQVAWRREGDNTPAGSLQPLVSVVYWYGPGEGGGGGEGPKIESIELQGENIVITYSSGTLQSATSIEGPW